MPSVSEPCATPYAPNPMITAIADSGSTTSTPHSAASSRTLSSSVPRRPRASATKRAVSLRPRPSDFSTRIPSADSSITVARSPAWSWARRASREKRRSSIKVSAVSGSVVSAMTSPSHGDSHSSTATPATSVSTLTTRKIPENATNQRIVVRSVVARDSSCPDGHRSWNETGSRCRWV